MARNLTAQRSIVDADSPFTFLQQRLRYVDACPDRTFINVAENVPCWPSPFPDGVLHAEDTLAYGPCEGSAFLLRAIEARERAVNKISPNPEEILVSNGALHGLSLVIRALAQPGSVALVQAPVYICIPQMLRAAGFRVRYFSAAAGLGELESLLGEDTRLIYVNSPNNPTGQVLSSAQMARLAELAASRGAKLLADVVYDSFAKPGVDRGSPLANREAWPHVYTVNSMSKNYGSPGLRVGWVLSSAENVRMLSALLERECVCVSGPSQRLAASILEHGNAALVDHVESGRRLLSEALRQVPGVVCEPGVGGTQLFASLPVEDIEAYGDTVLRELGLLLATCSQYEGVSGPFIRLPLGAPRDTLSRALKLLAESLAIYGHASPRI
ncbi:beta-methylarginine biosynthesis bifunctional aminotransferase [Archangium lipolyticum]|uniref:beta-methylarginine biosynthesis bifunctional aminotransferase n=1 Tax=Archangium lipolyticum TaxID=2970465 RepID=UPI002149CE11|nr:beta-methylarginine biosynthesis bifunctional aminotransferase [Archangium lipolyticum]